MRFHRRCSALLCVLAFACACRADSLDDLARDFWSWRAAEQPVTFDDIPRLERPAGWVPDWSPAAVVRYKQQLSEFEARWNKLDSSSWPVARQVDYRLMGSAIERLRWELEVVPNWKRDPGFYLAQTAGAYFEQLLPPPPFDVARTQHILAILASIPRTLQDGERNLSVPAAPLARLALGQLEDMGPGLQKSAEALKPFLDPAGSRNLDSLTQQAVTALDSYRGWINQRLPSMSQNTAIGRDAYVFFLKNVALLPFAPEQLLALGQQEWARSVAAQTYEEHRDAHAAQLPLFSSEKEQIAHQQKDELSVRQYLAENDILSVPGWLQHYRFAVMPSYLAPLQIGETDDFTGPSRLKSDGLRYINPPGPKLGYFALTMAKDPRPLIAHEGVPGHYFQLALSWANPDPIRRHYYDSSANEGIGFYAEEMLLDAGLFDDSPRTREIIWNFMRLRALRVEVDVKLALGQFTMEQAAEYLQHAVPMDSKTARSEAADFASTPGQAISYEIGKLQIYKFLADARRQKGNDFSLRAFHDFLWQNGNVPIALQRWQYLGLEDDVPQLDRKAARNVYCDPVCGQLNLARGAQ